METTRITTFLVVVCYVLLTLRSASLVSCEQDNNPYDCRLLPPNNPDLKTSSYYPSECYQVAIDNAPSSLKDVYVALNGPVYYRQSTIEEVLSTVGLLPDSCRIPLTSLICGAQYPLCDKNKGEFELLPVCFSLCEYVLETCSSDISIIEELKCQNLTLSFNETTCLPFNQTVTLLPATCPYPFLLDQRKDPICVMPCGSFFVSDTAASAASELKMWISVLSLISDIIIILSVLTSKERRKYPSNLIAFTVIPQMLIAITFIIGYGIGYENIWCRDETTQSTQSDKAYCGFEGAMIFLGAAALACYWLVISFNLFLAVVFDVNFADLEWKTCAIIATHSFAWGVPLIGLIVLASLKMFVYNPPYWWCWIGSGLDLYFFWIWVGIFLIVIGIFIIISCWRMYQIRKEVGRSVLRRNLRLIYFISLYFLLFGYNFGLYVKGRILEKETQEFTETYTTCLAEREEDCVFKTNFNTAELLIQIILLSGSGFLLLLAFETRSGSIPHWKRVFQLISKGQWKAVKQLGSTPSVE